MRGKGRRNGYWVPDEYVAQFVAKMPNKLYGFAACDPTQDGYMDELCYAIEKLGLVGLKMGVMYAGHDPRDPRPVLALAACTTGPFRYRLVFGLFLREFFLEARRNRCGTARASSLRTSAP